MTLVFDAALSARVLRELLDQSIKPYAESLARITADGGIAIVVHEPDARDAGLMAALAEAGWDGRPVLRMATAFRHRLLRGCAEMGDAVTVRWLRRKSPLGRVFVFMGRGTLLLNVGSAGITIEPGSLDARA
jgi:hypothetical protein